MDTEADKREVDSAAVAVAQITALSDRWLSAERSKNVDELRTILSDGFAFTSTSGRLVSKEEWLAMILNLQIERFDRSEHIVQIFGDTAIAGGVVNLQTKTPSTNLEGNYRYADVFVRRGSVWQVIYSHFTSIK